MCNNVPTDALPRVRSVANLKLFDELFDAVAHSQSPTAAVPRSRRVATAAAAEAVEGLAGSRGQAQCQWHRSAWRVMVVKVRTEEVYPPGSAGADE